ncbi:MAG: tyrosine-type recombinase/integrase, partial [Nitrospinota bacterium]
QSSCTAVPGSPYHSRMGVEWREWKKDKHDRQRYQIYWWHKGKQYNLYLDQTGSPLTDPVDTKAIADEIATEIKQKRHDPTRWLPEKRNKYAIVNAINAYTDVRAQDKITNKQRNDIKRYLEKLSAFCKGEKVKDLRDVTGLELQQFFNGLADYKYKTKKNCLTIISAFFRWSVKRGQLLKDMPYMPELDEPQDELIKYLTVEQQGEVLKHVPADYIPIIRFLMFYGTRPSEALAVQLEDVVWPEQTIVLQHTINSDNELVRCTKTKRMRFLYIDSEIEPVIAVAMKNRIGKDYLFINPRTGNRFSMWGIQGVWRSARKAAGLEEYVLTEGTRKTVATIAFNRGVDVKDVADALGNSPEILKKHYAQVTAQRYAHVFSPGKNVLPLKKKTVKGS